MTAGGWPRPAPAGLVGEHRAVPVGVEQFPLLLLRLRSGIRRTISRAVTRFFFGLEVNAVCSISAISAASISSQVAGSGIFHGYSIDACACRCPERVMAGPVTLWPVQFVIYAVVRPPGVPSTRNSLTLLTRHGDPLNVARRGWAQVWHRVHSPGSAGTCVTFSGGGTVGGTENR